MAAIFSEFFNTWSRLSFAFTYEWEHLKLGCTDFWQNDTKETCGTCLTCLPMWYLSCLLMFFILKVQEYSQSLVINDILFSFVKHVNTASPYSDFALTLKSSAAIYVSITLCTFSFRKWLPCVDSELCLVVVVVSISVILPITSWAPSLVLFCSFVLFRSSDHPGHMCP